MSSNYRVKTIIEDSKKRADDLFDCIKKHPDPFLYSGRDENVRDVLYHLYGWHNILMDLISRNPKPPIELKPGYTWKNLEKLNYDLKTSAEAYSLEDVIKLFKQSHERMMLWIQGLSDEDLNAPDLYPFTAPSTLGEFVYECMGGHYTWAIQTIEFHRGEDTLRSLLDELKQLPAIEAIVLGGSRGKQQGDTLSDYDIYVYTTTTIPVETRKKIIDPYVSLMEYNHIFFETEDDGILNNGIGIEFIYRNLNDFKQMMKNLFELKVNRGYSTCFLDNLLTTKIIFDRNGSYKALQQTYRFKDKRKIYQTVVKQNIPLLYGTQPCYYDQIVKAVKRQDLVAVNHRLTEYLSLFFDTLFAINQVNHPGEKRMLEKAMSLPLKPSNLAETIENMCTHLGEEAYLEELKSMTLELIKIAKND